MVFENATVWPTPEDHKCPPPDSTYGFQKLACEYFAKGAWEQYKLPYTICRPFNCVGIGERRALGDKDIPSGNIKLAMSHVVPDIVQKIARGQDRTNWKKVDAITGSRLEASIRADGDDVHGEPDWTQAVMGIPARKDHINIRVDHDVLGRRHRRHLA